MISTFRKGLSLLAIFLLSINIEGAAQIQDSTKIPTEFSGSLGITNNGFAIIPSFSLNSPAVILLFSIKKNRFSFDPDVRLTTDARKGGILFWFRYRVIEGSKFSLRIGIHPAMNLQTRKITDNGVTTEITQMRRFIASEIAPNYRITPNWSVGLYYLQGNGLQKDGPRTTHFLTFNTSITNLKVSKNFRLKFSPSIYHLYLDGYKGNYFAASAELSHVKFPFTLQSIVNKTFTSNLPGNKDLLWNITLGYHFSKKLIRIK